MQYARPGCLTRTTPRVYRARYASHLVLRSERVIAPRAVTDRALGARLRRADAGEAWHGRPAWARRRRGLPAAPSFSEQAADQGERDDESDEPVHGALVDEAG
jgi:hypothetical protein